MSAEEKDTAVLRRDFYFWWCWIYDYSRPVTTIFHLGPEMEWIAHFTKAMKWSNPVHQIRMNTNANQILYIKHLPYNIIGTHFMCLFQFLSIFLFFSFYFSSFYFIFAMNIYRTFFVHNDLSFMFELSMSRWKKHIKKEKQRENRTRSAHWLATNSTKRKTERTNVRHI